MRRHRGTPEQVRKFDEAFRALSENAEIEGMQGIRHETQEFRRLLARANALTRPLSFWQRSTMAAYHRLNKQYGQENRAARQERKVRRREARTADPASRRRTPRTARQRTAPARRNPRQGRTAR